MLWPLPPVKAMFVAFQWAKGMHGFGRAQDAAVVRKDITVAEVFDLLVALVHVAELRGRGSRSAQIALRVVLDGLGVRGASS